METPVAEASSSEAAPEQRVAHVVVTRFNLFSRVFRAAQTDDTYAAWCARRVALCRAITIPSLLAQRMRRFRWLVLMDVETNYVLDDFTRGLAALPFADVVRVDLRGVSRHAFKGAVSRHILETISRDVTHVCTTRLDSDDGLHARHLGALARAVQDAHAAIDAAEMTRFVMPYSLRWDGRTLQVGIYPRNHFASVVEPVRPERPLQTAYFDKHNVHLPNDVIVSTRFPATLTCVHSINLLNTMSDYDLTVVDSGDLLADFGIDRSLAGPLLTA